MTIKRFCISIFILCLVVFAVFLYVKQGEAPTQIQNTQENKDIVINNPQADQIITSPLKLSGKARGNWFFEASAPVELVDEKGNRITEKYITAQGEWMTTDFVPFEGELVFTIPTGVKKGTLIFKKDNPSGEAKFDKSVSIPVRFE